MLVALRSQLLQLAVHASCCMQPRFQRDMAVPMPSRAGRPNLLKHAARKGAAGAVALAGSQLPAGFPVTPLTTAGTCHRIAPIAAHSAAPQPRGLSCSRTQDDGMTRSDQISLLS